MKERGNFNFGLWMNRVHNGMEARHSIRSLKLADCSLIHAHIAGRGRKWCEDINPQSSTLTFKYPNDLLLFVYCSFRFKIVCFSTQSILIYSTILLTHIIESCYGKMRIIPHMFMYLNNGSQLVLLFGQTMKHLGGEYFLEEVHHRLTNMTNPQSTSF